MSSLGDLSEIGYLVNSDGVIASIRGFGIATVITAADQAAIDSLYNLATNGPVPSPAPPTPGPTVQEKVAAALQEIQTGDGSNPVTADQLAKVIQALTS